MIYLQCYKRHHGTNGSLFGLHRILLRIIYTHYIYYTYIIGRLLTLRGNPSCLFAVCLAMHAVSPSGFRYSPVFTVFPDDLYLESLTYLCLPVTPFTTLCKGVFVKYRKHCIVCYILTIYNNELIV